MHGNRDFLFGQRFATATGMTLLDDPCTIDLYGKKIILTHGDSLCTDDRAHQRFRHFTQNKNYQSWFLKLPLTLRKKIANTLRNKSKQQAQSKPAAIMDVTEQAVTDLFLECQTKLMIHGHTHRMEYLPRPHLWRPGGVQFAASVGCLCKQVPLYGIGAPVEWQNGFVLGYIGSHSEKAYPVEIAGGHCILPDGTRIEGKE